MNGITKLQPFDRGKITRRDIMGVLFKEFGGASVSYMPDDTLESVAYSKEWEYFDPDNVSDPDALPYYWKMVYDFHNRPEMGDCRRFHYKYVHIPVNILPSYPRVLVKGIFVINDLKNDIPLDKITADDLIWIGNEFTD